MLNEVYHDLVPETGERLCACATTNTKPRAPLATASYDAKKDRLIISDAAGVLWAKETRAAQSLNEVETVRDLELDRLETVFQLPGSTKPPSRAGAAGRPWAV